MNGAHFPSYLLGAAIIALLTSVMALLFGFGNFGTEGLFILAASFGGVGLLTGVCFLITSMAGPGQVDAPPGPE